jgi:hypothetical protein
MTEQWVQTISEKYIELYERITGEAFVPAKHLSPKKKRTKRS